MNGSANTSVSTKFRMCPCMTQMKAREAPVDEQWTGHDVLRMIQHDVASAPPLPPSAMRLSLKQYRAATAKEAREKAPRLR